MVQEFVHRPGLLPGAVASAVAYEMTDAVPGEHRGLPSPWLTFIVSTDGAVRVDGTVADRDCFSAPRATSYDVLVAGLHPAATRVEQPRRQAGLQLSVHPLAARPLLGMPAAELAELPGVQGVDVLGPVAAELHDRVSSRPHGEDRLDVLQDWVRSRFEKASRSAVRPELVAAWRLIASRRGAVRVDEVARTALLSERQLRALMRAELGLGPKQLCRQFRFAAVVEQLTAGVGVAEVAARTGYADQSHLTREFRQMAGSSPTAWLADERRNIQDGGHRNRPSSDHD